MITWARGQKWPVEGPECYEQTPAGFAQVGRISYYHTLKQRSQNDVPVVRFLQCTFARNANDWHKDFSFTDGTGAASCPGEKPCCALTLRGSLQHGSGGVISLISDGF